MKDLLTYLFFTIAGEEAERIKEADSNPGKWYELFIIREDDSTETVESSNTFSEIIKNIEQYAVKYKFDCINIGIYENRESPNNSYSFFSTSLLYSIIFDYFRRMEKLDNMRFAGSITFVDHNPVLEKEYVGDESNIFINEIAFTYFHNLVCYLPDYGEETDPADWCTRKDFLEITNNDEKLAQHLFDEVTWEYPSTLFDQWDSHGTLDEWEKMTVYSYTDSGDFVHCNYCDKTMLLPIGADKCPSCHYEGSLAWADENQPEMTRSELEQLEKYNIVDKDKLEFSEYLSVEALIEDFGSTSYEKLNNSGKNIWEIIDSGRTIFSGNEEEMQTTFQEIVNGEIVLEWDGDLKLIEIHGIHK
jgi:hypothetical protein